MEDKVRELEDKVAEAVSALIAQAEAWVLVRRKHDQDDISLESDSDAVGYAAERLESAVEKYRESVAALHSYMWKQ